MVKLSASDSLDSLVDLACRDGVDIRPTLLRVVTDLYVQKPIHGAEEETQFVELALGLIDAVDAQTRAAVAASLSAYAAAPAAVLRKLAAAPSAGPRVRGEPARNDLIALFFSANPDERRLILTNLDVASEAPPRRPAPVAGELVRRLEGAALKRDQGEFIRVLERALGVSRALAEVITRDNSGEPIVVAAKAIGIKADVLQRILLFLNPVIGQSAQRIYELARLYDELRPGAVDRMLAIWRTTTPRRPVHAPVYWNDERAPPRPASTPPSQRPVAENNTRPSARIKGT
jgi:hypothetical protein